MGGDSSHARPPLDERDHISLCETLDRVLNKGVVVAGDIVISVADVDLIYLGLRLVLSSVETARRVGAIDDVRERKSVKHECLPTTQS
ncbi:gas vesicle protein [Candidatus Poribacteria bacterium]|nr:gas vesicle protein [Candidatus Poribacteria bacterium]